MNKNQKRSLKFPPSTKIIPSFYKLKKEVEKEE